MHDLKTPEGVAAHMSESTSVEDWNTRAMRVKTINGGYPDFWYEVVILSGIANKVLDDS